MVDVITKIIIDKPVSKVARYAMNPDNAPTWYVNIKSAEWVTPGPAKIGEQIAFKAYFLGKELAYVYIIAEMVPNQKMVMRTANGPFPMETTYTFSKEGEDKTRMTLRNRGEPKGFSKIFAPFMAMMMRKANMKDLKMIKSILENQNQDETG